MLAATQHGVTSELEALWQEVQAHTATLSAKGRLVVVEGSRHFIQSDRAPVVIDAVLDAMCAAKVEITNDRAPKSALASSSTH